MRTTIKAKGNSTSAGNGASYNIAGTTLGISALHIKVWATDKTAQFTVEDSVNAHSANIVRHSVAVPAGVTANSPQEFVVKRRDLPALREGVTSAVLRVNIAEIGGGSGNITWEAWIEADAAIPAV